YDDHDHPAKCEDPRRQAVPPSESEPTEDEWHKDNAHYEQQAYRSHVCRGLWSTTMRAKFRVRRASLRTTVACEPPGRWLRLCWHLTAPIVVGDSLPSAAQERQDQPGVLV